MPRELYPYPPEREVIRAFLGGDGTLRTPISDTSLYVTKGALMCDGGMRCLWYDSADAVTTVVEGPIAKHIANYVLEQMGVEERITVEVDENAEKNHTNKHRVRYFFGGVPADEAPFVLVGPMTLMAWRAENGFKLRRK